jgi:hypothetical protein
MAAEVAKPDGTSVVNEECWNIYSDSALRQDEVGKCAEENGGTPGCVPGMCELCCNCSLHGKLN